MAHQSQYELHGREKPCRNCFDPRSWFKMTGKPDPGEIPKEQKIPAGSSIDDESKITKSKECPPFVDELGRSTWNLLHTMAAKFPDNPSDEHKVEMKTFLSILSKYYPCEYCAKDFRRDLKDSPPDLTSQKSYAIWMCQLHNLVNKKLGKATYDCNLVQQRWKDGWDDGSCD